MRRLLLLALAFTASTAAKTPDTPDHDLAGRTPGKAESCVQENRIDTTHLYPDGRILYRMRGSTDYLNNAGPGCKTTAINPVLITATPSSSICRGDIVRVVDSAARMFYGSCGLGDFIPYPKVKKP